MIFASLATMAASILLSLAAKGMCQRVSPAVVAVVFTVASVAVAVASSGLVAVIAWYGAARVGTIATTGGWSPNLLSRTTPLPLPLSAVAGLVALVIVYGSIRLWVRRFAELRSAHRSWATDGRFEITVTSDPEVDAFCVDGTATTRRVVLTAGLLRELPDPALLRAVIEHERSHLRHHHLLYRLAVESAAGANPFLRPVRRTVDDALEAWADDDAALSNGRANVATAIATVALARTTPQRQITLAMADFSTVRRVERLLQPHYRRGHLGAVVGAVLPIVPIVALTVCCRHTETFFEVLRTASGR